MRLHENTSSYFALRDTTLRHTTSNNITLHYITRRTSLRRACAQPLWSFASERARVSVGFFVPRRCHSVTCVPLRRCHDLRRPLLTTPSSRANYAALRDALESCGMAVPRLLAAHPRSGQAELGLLSADPRRRLQGKAPDGAACADGDAKENQCSV